MLLTQSGNRQAGNIVDCHGNHSVVIASEVYGAISVSGVLHKEHAPEEGKQRKEPEAIEGMVG